MQLPKNVLGTELKSCCTSPMTGFYRDGYCRTGISDKGLHIICCVMTEEFLAFSQQVGNDLSTPIPEYGFSGLQPGDQWCLCMLRWKEALENSVLLKLSSRQPICLLSSLFRWKISIAHAHEP